MSYKHYAKAQHY